MNNNDLLIALKEALDLSHKETLDIFTLGGLSMTKERLALNLKYSKAY